MDRKPLAAVIVIVGIASASAVALLSLFKTLAIIIGALTLFAAGSLLSNARQLSVQLRTFIGKKVMAKVWGMELPRPAECRYEVVSVRGLGAGLLIHLRHLPDGERTLLKVAQPAGSKVDAASVQIQQAAYVQWAGSKIKKPVGGIAPALSMQIID